MIFLRILSLILCYANLLHASGGDSSINWWSLGAQYKDAPALGWLTITFLIFAFFVLRAIKKPLGLYLETRSKDIRKQIKEGEEAKIAGEKKLKYYEDKLRSLDQEISELKQKFHEQAEHELTEKERLSKLNEARIMHDVDETIRSNFERSKNKLAEEVVEMALAKAQKIILETKKEELDQALSLKLIKDIRL